MPTGASPLYYPEQPPPPSKLELDNSYFRVQLHHAQAFFKAGWLTEPGFVTLSSSVESSFQPGSPIQSLHRISTLQKNTPCGLGVGTNLTQYLPVRPSDSLRIAIKYTVSQDKPVQNLLTQMQQTGLVAQLSLARPDWAVALKVSDVAGKLLSYLLREGSEHDIFDLKIDLNLSDLKTGYYVVLGSKNDENWPEPRILKIDQDSSLITKTGGSLSHLCYAVIKVAGLSRQMQEVFRDEPWWELLQIAKENILDAIPDSELERRELLGEWRFALKQVKSLARKRREFLWSEIQEILATAETEVQAKLKPPSTPEAFGFDELPDDLQEILEVETKEDLQKLVRDYHDALEVSQKLLADYNL
jgi:hypothetical protein